MSDGASKDRPGLLEQDNYGVALQEAVAQMRAANLGLQADRAGARPGPEGLVLSFFGAPVRIDPEQGQVTARESGQALPLWEQILVLHYLLGAADGLAELAGDWVAFRELPEAAFYDTAFRQQVAEPLARRFGSGPNALQALKALQGRWGTTAGEQGDASLVFPAFPHVRICFQIWAADEDFPAEANVLFSRSAAACLTAEDAAVLADVALRGVLKAADEPAADEPAADEPTADEPTADEPAADEPAGDEEG
jgi:hypothetical protein